MSVGLVELRNNAVERRNFLAPMSKFDDQKHEFLFVLDRSGSMSRSNRIEMSRRAAALFLRSLPQSCIFNVIGFGTHFETLFPKSVPYTQDNLEKATVYANGMQANMGENDVAKVLQHIYSTPQTPGYFAQIFVLTDGCHELAPQPIINVVLNNKPAARVFALGIGQDASQPLVTGLAQAGNGVSDFVLSATEKIETKVLGQLKLAMKPPMLKAVPA